MGKNKRLKEKKQEIFDTKIFFMEVIKKYGIVILICAPLAIGLNFLLNYLFVWYTGVVMFVATLVFLLLGIFVGVVVYNKIEDSKEEKAPDKNKQRDPFAD